MLSSTQIEDFFTYLRFSTISADPTQAQAMKNCVAWLRDKFVRLGFFAKIYPTPGAPIFVAKSVFDTKKRTVLIYGHYDVQPVDPLELWQHPPFAPVLENGLVIARGATDNKGQTFAHILGTEAWLASKKELPVNLIYLIEGEEEIGSPNLFSFLQEHRQELACDLIVISDTSMVAPGFPALTCGLRGITCLEVLLTGPQADLHSGMFGGVIANPALELSRLLAKLHHPDKSVALPGFYDDVQAASSRELTQWKTLPYTEKEIQISTGVSQLDGETAYTPLERIWTRPTAEINGLTSGYQGPGSKTIIPKWARAKLSFRLVPNQKPDQIANLVRDFFLKECPSTMQIEVTLDHGGLPYYHDPESPDSRATQGALEEVFGRAPALVREGLSIPIVTALQDVLGRSPLLIGLGLPDCRAHSPNETFPLEQLDLGHQLHQKLLETWSKAHSTSSSE